MSTVRPICELAEWQAIELPGTFLSDSDRQVVGQLGGDAGSLVIDELRTGLRVKARSWIGVVRLESVEIRVVPKLAGSNLGVVEMLAYTTGLEALRRNRGIRDLEIKESNHLFDLIALIFAEACEQVVRSGLLHGYVRQETDLPVLRGRLLADRQIRRRFGQIDRLECQYDDHVVDILENQILTGALEICRRRTSNPYVQYRIHRLHTLFASVTARLTLSVADARALITYNRLNEYYREAHEIAWLVLESMGIDDLLATGPTRSFAFLLDMNRLFEQFVSKLLMQVLSRLGYRLRIQKGDRSIIWDVSKKRPYTRVIPDVLVESPSGKRLAIDAKYKLYDERRLSTSDIYQSFLYAYAYSQGDISRSAALLIYPALQRSGQLTNLQVRSSLGRSGAHIKALGIHIPQILAELAVGMSGEAINRLVETIQQVGQQPRFD